MNRERVLAALSIGIGVGLASPQIVRVAAAEPMPEPPAPAPARRPRAPKRGRPLTEFDVARIARAEEKRERRAAILRSREAAP